LQKLPLADGVVRFPGGRAAWTAAAGSGEDVLLDLPTLEALVPIADIEQQRKKPFDEASVKLLLQNYSAWRSLAPYFVRLTDLHREEFEALARFTGAVIDYPAARRNSVLGEWHSLMELISRGVQAGSINQAAAAVA